MTDDIKTDDTLELVDAPALAPGDLPELPDSLKRVAEEGKDAVEGEILATVQLEDDLV